MANDDESVFRAARKAAGQAHSELEKARDRVRSAGAAFDGAVGVFSWNSLGDKLKRRDACAAHAKELQAAVASAQAALIRAQAACDALRRAAQP
ncbi:MAG: hypothetical protein ACT4RN_12390 [Pseudonocardia sp.]